MVILLASASSVSILAPILVTISALLTVGGFLYLILLVSKFFISHRQSGNS
jgi:hypothetical protein